MPTKTSIKGEKLLGRVSLSSISKPNLITYNIIRIGLVFPITDNNIDSVSIRPLKKKNVTKWAMKWGMKDSYFTVGHTL